MTRVEQEVVKIKVWDSPTRVFHWALAICFAGATITQEMESLRLVHITFGYTMLMLVMFRLIWGVVGTRYARFTSFVPNARHLRSYLTQLVTLKPMHTVGHNPLGALAVIAILALVIGIAVSGILLNNGIQEEIFEEVHESLANALFFVVGLHLVGVAFSCFLHKENLVASMVTGNKVGEPSAGIRHNFLWLALVMMIGIGYFWFMQIQ